MINLMHSMEKPIEKTLDPHLWQACAGGMTQIPPVNSKVYYFPQGHAEHACKNADFHRFSRVPPLVPCRVSSIKHLADTETDDVYAKIRLVPIKENECDVDDEGGLGGLENIGEKEKANSFAKSLTQSDANNGGGFSVPRYCAETIFPKLDYTAEPPVQSILVKDVHGEVWKFRHIYRGTPRRHLLTTGWSNFVNRKKLVAGDSIVFLRAENGDLCVGIRRSKTGIGCGPEVPSGWNTHGLYGFSSENGMRNIKNGNGNCDSGVKEKSNMGAESVIEAVSLAVGGQAFEVIYYPRASTPEFVVRASAVNAAMRVQWYPGMRFKMAFETEDSSRISWFMGTVSSVQVDDPIRWPNSPWRLLQVAWDEPDLLQNVKRVNPWLVELVSNIAAIHHFPYASPPKRPRVPQPLEFPMPFSPLTKMSRVPQPPEFSMGQLPLLSNNHPLSPSSPLYCLPDNYVSAGIQGARHAQFMLSSTDLHFNHLQTGLRPFDFKPLSYACPLKKESSTQKNDDEKTPVFVLFGQPIFEEQQKAQSCSMDNGGISLSDGHQENTGNVSHGSGSAVIQNSPPEASSDEEFQQ